MLKKWLQTVLLCMLVGLVVAGCDTKEVEPTPTVTPQVPVQVQLSWLHSIEFAGLYMAKAHGYYAQENLDVSLQSGGFDSEGAAIDPIEQVISGEADFGVADGTLLLVARSEGKPLIALMTIYQAHPLAFVSMAENSLERPQDLIGRTVHISSGSEVVFQALLRQEGIDPARINIVERQDFTTAPLTSGEADVIDGWVTNEIVTLTEEGHTFSAILPSDYGVEAYPNVIFTTEEIIANHPEMVRSFVKATLRGMKSAVEDPEQSAALSVEYNPDMVFKTEELAMQQSLPLLLPMGSRLGAMDAAVWDFMHQTLLDQDILADPIGLEQAYTLQFLDENNQG